MCLVGKNPSNMNLQIYWPYTTEDNKEPESFCNPAGAVKPKEGAMNGWRGGKSLKDFTIKTLLFVCNVKIVTSNDCIAGNGSF